MRVTMTSAPSLTSLVRLDLAALVLVLLTFPWTFLFHFTRTPRFTIVTTHLLLLLTPALIGYLCDWWLQRRIQRGIYDDTWDQPHLDAAAQILNTRTRKAFSLLMLLTVAAFFVTLLLSSNSAFNSHGVAIWGISTLPYRFRSLLQTLSPTAESKPQTFRSQFLPLHSTHWGER